MGKYKKVTTPVEKIIREVIIDKKAADIIENELRRNRVISAAYLATRANIRISVARKYLDSLVSKGVVKPLTKGFGMHYVIIKKQKSPGKGKSAKKK